MMKTMSPNAASSDTRAVEFEAYRPLLFSIGYRMLGSVAEAEDAVQETYLRYTSVPAGEVRSTRSFLTTVVTRICLDQLKSARAQRETYIGPWLPEPLVAGDTAGMPVPSDVAEDHESISMAFLVLLETLTPIERAVFLLREVFDYGYDEVARIVGRSEVACRQIFRRAKQHVVSRRPRFECSNQEQERLVRSFLQACEAGDLEGLTGLLAEDVTLWSDGGGKRAAALKPIHGADRVVRLIMSFLQREQVFVDHEAHIVEVNGTPGLLGSKDGVVDFAMSFETHAGRIRAFHMVVNPDKLKRITVPFSGEASSR